MRSHRRSFCLLTIRRYRFPIKWLDTESPIAEHEMVLRAVTEDES
jgi:hypothetical protein